MDPLAQTRTEIHSLRRAVHVRTIAIVTGVVLIVSAIIGLGVRFNAVAEDAKAAASTGRDTSKENNRILNLIESVIDPNGDYQRQAAEAARANLCYHAQIHRVNPPPGVDCGPDQD